MQENIAVEKDEPPRKKTRRFSQLLWLIILIIYLVIVYFAMNHIIGLQFPDKWGNVRFHQGYMPWGGNYVALSGAAFMLVFVILAHIAFLRDLTGWKKIITNTIVILLFFGVIELYLKKYISSHPGRYRPHPYLLWELYPGQENRDEHINSKGLRYKEFPVKKEINEFRFLLIGDSSAYGYRVADGQRFGDILERKLQERYPATKIRVINAAVEGYSVCQIRVLYDLKLRQFSPDCIIIAFNNDPIGDEMTDRERMPPKSLAPVFHLLYKSDLFLLLRKHVLTMKEKNLHREGKGPSGESKWRVPEEDVRKHYSYLIRDVKKSGGRGIIISMPQIRETYGEWSDIVKYRKIIEDIAQKTNSLFLDIFHKWQDSPDQNKKFFIEDNVHPNTQGHREIGEDLFEMIIRSGLVEKEE